MVAHGEMPAGEIDTAMGKMSGSCNATHWSAETMDCFANASSGDAAEACIESTMTEEQGEDLEHAMKGD